MVALTDKEKMNSVVKTLEYENGEIQRYQCVTLDSFDELDFVKPKYSKKAFDRVCTLYRYFIVKRVPWVFGRMVLFHIPKDFKLPEGLKVPKKYGEVTDWHIIASIAFKEGLRVKKDGTLIYRNKAVRELAERLMQADYLEVVCGKLPFTKILPVGDEFGILSECGENASLRANANFFIMDSFDVASRYDTIGTGIGLLVKNGEVINPPLYEREGLFVYEDGTSEIKIPDIKKLFVEINGVIVRDGEKGTIFFTRPEYRKTPIGKATEIVVVGRKVVAVCHGGRTTVPASGFVIYAEGKLDSVKPGDTVNYLGMEDVKFAVSIGNSIIKDGIESPKVLLKVL